MKIDVNGVVRDMTPEEVVALSQSEDREPTIEERLSAVEAATLDLILGGAV